MYSETYYGLCGYKFNFCHRYIFSLDFYCSSPDKFGKEHPLKVIQVGGGACDPNEKEIGNDSCGGQKRGNCRTFRKVCQCEEGWAGPHCLAHDPQRIVEDHVIYQVFESIEPIMLPAGLAMSLISMAGFLGFTIALKRRLDGWKPIDA